MECYFDLDMFEPFDQIFVSRTSVLRYLPHGHWTKLGKESICHAHKSIKEEAIRYKDRFYLNDVALTEHLPNAPKE